MYATLSLDRLIKFMIWPFALIIVILLIWQGLPVTASEWLRLASSSVTIFAILMVIVGSSSKAYSPWRLIWRMCPFLNETVFPDLNGTWVGTTCSNWPLIEAQRNAALASGGLKQTALDQIALQEDAVVLNIRASLFKLQISAAIPDRIKIIFLKPTGDSRRPARYFRAVLRLSSRHSRTSDDGRNCPPWCGCTRL